MQIALSLMTLIVPALAFGATSPTPAAAPGVDWSLDAGHSRVGFVVKHLAVTNVRGEFKEFATPVLKADAATGKITALEATAQTKTVNTGNEKRDEHLRNDDFFNAEKFPVLKMKLKTIAWDGDKFTADVELAIRDKSKVVKLEGEKSGVSKVNFGDGPQARVGYSASAKINRKDFGLGWNKAIEAVNVVADEVKLELEIEIYRKG